MMGQFGQFWHMVTPMDPRDVLESIIRVAYILYPTPSSVVAGAMTSTSEPGECTWARAAQLAAHWAGEEAEEEEGCV